MVRRIGLVLACLVIVMGCDSGTPKSYLSKPGKFRVTMPRTPKETTQQMPTEVGPIAAHVATAEASNRIIYSVTYADLPVGVNINADAALDGSCQGMIASTQGVLTAKRPIKLGTVPGREIRFNVSPAGSKAEGLALAQVYLDGNRFYQLLVLGPKSAFNETAALAFCESFKIGDDLTVQPQMTPVDQNGNVEKTAPKAMENVPWGKVINGDDVTRVRVEGAAATMELQGRNYTLGHEGTADDSPRIMRPISGDFIARVRVVGDDHLTDSAAPDAKVSFHGAGLLLVGKPNEIIRLERASFHRGGRLQRYVLFEQHLRNAPVSGQNLVYDGGPVTLKLERKGDVVNASFSVDGVNWTSFPTYRSTIKAGEVGVSAINTSSLPFLACFEGLNVESQ